MVEKIKYIFENQGYRFIDNRKGLYVAEQRFYNNWTVQLSFGNQFTKEKNSILGIGYELLDGEKPLRTNYVEIYLDELPKLLSNISDNISKIDILMRNPFIKHSL